VDFKGMNQVLSDMIWGFHWNSLDRRINLCPQRIVGTADFKIKMSFGCKKGIDVQKITIYY
jgi:hypothetical protein